MTERLGALPSVHVHASLAHAGSCKGPLVVRARNTAGRRLEVSQHRPVNLAATRLREQGSPPAEVLARSAGCVERRLPRAREARASKPFERSSDQGGQSRTRDRFQRARCPHPALHRTSIRSFYLMVNPRIGGGTTETDRAVQLRAAVDDEVGEAAPSALVELAEHEHRLVCRDRPPW